MKDAATLSILTETEKKIAESIAWGMTKKEIAKSLQLSGRTIENHTRNIFKKVGVSKSNELSAWWFCSNYNVPMTDSPVAKVVIIAFALITIKFVMI